MSGIILSFSRATTACVLGLSTRTVERLRAEGELETYLAGKRGVRITERSIVAYQERQLALYSGCRVGNEAESEVDPYAIPLLDQLKRDAAQRQEPTEMAA